MLALIKALETSFQHSAAAVLSDTDSAVRWTDVSVLTFCCVLSSLSSGDRYHGGVTTLSCSKCPPRPGAETDSDRVRTGSLISSKFCTLSKSCLFEHALNKRKPHVLMSLSFFCQRLYFALTSASFIYCSFSWVRSPAVRPRNLIPRPLGDAPGLCR